MVYHYALYLLKIEPLNKAKSAWLYPLDKMSDQEIEKFYQEVLEPCYYLGTKTDIKDGKYTSQMIGKNCKNEEKVKRIQEVIKNHNLEIDYDLSYAYSDSLHDIPMLKMVKNRIKIDTKDGHMSTFEIE